MKTFFAYTRKSSESDERQSQSIVDQLDWITKKINWEPFKLFSESKSAKDPWERQEFEKMMKEIQKKSDWESIIICWKLDRLSRNPVDSWLIQYLMQKGKLSKIITNDREYTATDAGLLMSVENAMSNQFILDLKKNVERWMKSKVEKGWCIQNVPLGYINNKNTKQAELDLKTAPLVKELFELREAQYSLREIADIMNKKWLTGQKWWKLTSSTVDQILKNPFYIWLQKFQGKLHKSIHDKIISIELWEKVNWVKRGYEKKEDNFPLKWIIKNWHTKKPLLALFKKNKKYIYYSTHSREDNIINMNQNHIINAFDSIIHMYCLPAELMEDTMEKIKDVCNEYYWDLKEKRKVLENNIKQLNIKSERLFNLVLKWTINDEKYKSENNQIVIDQENIELEIQKLNKLDLTLIEESRNMVELLINLNTKRKTISSHQKALLIRIIVEELFVDTKKQLYIQENELFEYIKILNGYYWQGP